MESSPICGSASSGNRPWYPMLWMVNRVRIAMKVGSLAKVLWR